MRLGAILALSTAVLGASSARADDSKKDSVTVLPWTQGSLLFAGGDKSAAVTYTQLFGDQFMFFAKGSAPLDSDTRIAAFTSSNKLSKGFSGSVQFGYDERAKAFGMLERRVQLAIEGTKALREGRIGQSIPFDDVLAYKARHPSAPVAESAAMKRFLCGATTPCTEPVVAREVCKTLKVSACATEADDTKAFDGATTAAIAVASSTECTANPQTSNDENRDRCFLSRWWLQINAFAVANRSVTQLVVDAETTKVLWAILDAVDPDKSKELKKEIKATDAHERAREENRILVLNLDTFKDALAKLKRQNPALARRDLLLTGLLGKPSEQAQAIAVGLDVEYDVLSIHQDDLAAKAVKDPKYDLTMAVDYTYYPTIPGLAFNVRGGIGRTRDPKGKKAELCTALPSTDMTVTGKNCDANSLFRKGDAPDAETSAFLRLALTYQYGVGKSEDEVVPGVEVRGGWERTGDDDAVAARLSLFGTPVKGTTALRVGIALDVGYAINIGDADTRWRVTPLVFVGASFSQLESSSL